jgi:hypothetical protein
LVSAHHHLDFPVLLLRFHKISKWVPKNSLKINFLPEIRALSQLPPKKTKKQKKILALSKLQQACCTSKKPRPGEKGSFVIGARETKQTVLKNESQKTKTQRRNERGKRHKREKARTNRQKTMIKSKK